VPLPTTGIDPGYRAIADRLGQIRGISLTFDQQTTQTTAQYTGAGGLFVPRTTFFCGCVRCAFTSGGSAAPDVGEIRRDVDRAAQHVRSRCRCTRARRIDAAHRRGAEFEPHERRALPAGAMRARFVLAMSRLATRVISRASRKRTTPAHRVAAIDD
jgi:hypothetical protein